MGCGTPLPVRRWLSDGTGRRVRQPMAPDGAARDRPARDRDAEFVLSEADTRANLLAAWERGWAAVFEAVRALAGSDLGRSVTIRGEPHTVRQALLRGMTHAAYHTGQILYL